MPHSQSDLRPRLVDIALTWQQQFGVAPSITSAVSEYDAAALVGMTEQEYGLACCNRTAVSRGWDFLFKGIRYQVKGEPAKRKGGFASNACWKTEQLRMG